MNVCIDRVQVTVKRSNAIKKGDYIVACCLDGSMEVWVAYAINSIFKYCMGNKYGSYFMLFGSANMSLNYFEFKIYF